jgi:hypothetical protein
MRNKLQQGTVAMVAASSLITVNALDPGKLLLYSNGPLSLKPQFNLTETFNDNITYRKENQKADLISVISPGLALQLGRRDFNIFEFTYFYDRLMYADNNEFDANQHHISTRLRLKHRRLTLDGTDTLDFLSSPLGGGYSTGFVNDRGEPVIGVGGAKVDRWNLTDIYRLSWEASDRTDLYLQLFHSYVDYLGDLALYDSDTIQGTLGFDYRPLPKTYFFGEIYFGQTDNQRNSPILFEYPQTDFLGFFLGARGEFTDRLHGTAKAGYEHRSYSSGGDTFDAPVVELSLDEQLGERTLLTAGYSRRQYESIQFVRSPYTVDSIFMSWQQQIGSDGRLRSTVRGAYLVSSFDSSGQFPNREDNIISATLTISYDIKLWLRAFGSYNFERLNSNERSIVDYNVNRVSLGLQLGY